MPHNADPNIVTEADFPYKTISINGTWSRLLQGDFERLLAQVDPDDLLEDETYNRIVNFLNALS